MKILCFGIAKELTGSSELDVHSADISNVQALRTFLLHKFPEFGKYKKYMIAVNQEYAGDERSLQESDEIAIIPPVSGG